MENIEAHLAKLKAELDQARQSGDTGKINHLEGELKDPSPLEVYCDLNPNAPECLVYDD